MKTIKEIDQVSGVLTKSYWLFCREHIRDGKWSEYFLRYVNEYIEGDTEINNKRTNFPRRIWQMDNMGWLVYMEALFVLADLYDSLELELSLVDSKGSVVSYKTPITQDSLKVFKGSIIHRDKDTAPGRPLITKDLDRSDDNWLGFVLRELYRTNKMTHGSLLPLLNKFIDNVENVSNFLTKQKAGIRSSIRNTMFKGNVSWPNFLRALRVLCYSELTLTIITKYKGRVKTTKIAIGLD